MLHLRETSRVGKDYRIELLLMHQINSSMECHGFHQLRYQGSKDGIIAYGNVPSVLVQSSAATTPRTRSASLGEDSCIRRSKNIVPGGGGDQQELDASVPRL